MNEVKKYNEKGIEVRKPFTFVHIGVNVEPQTVMQSHEGYIYAQGEDKTPSAIIPTENPMDPYIETVCQTSVLYSYNNIKSAIAEAAQAVCDRYNCTVEQNLNIIHFEGFRKFIAKYIIKPIPENTFALQIIPFKFYSEELFGAERKHVEVDPDDFYNDPGHSVAPCYEPTKTKYLTLENPNLENILTDNITDCLIRQIQHVGRRYSSIINYLISNDFLDIDQICTEAMLEDNIDPESIDRSIYISYATAILNEVAINDINKLKDMLIINNTQIISEYLDVLHVIYNDSLEKDIKGLPDHKDTARIYKMKK